MTDKETCQRHSGKWEDGCCKIDVRMENPKEDEYHLVVDGNPSFGEPLTFQERAIDDEISNFSKFLDKTISRSEEISRGIRKLNDRVLESLKDIQYFVEVRSPQAGDKNKEKARQQVSVRMPEELQDKDLVKEHLQSAIDTLVTGEQVFELEDGWLKGQAMDVEEVTNVLSGLKDTSEKMMEFGSIFRDFTEIATENEERKKQKLDKEV